MTPSLPQYNEIDLRIQSLNRDIYFRTATIQATNLELYKRSKDLKECESLLVQNKDKFNKILNYNENVIKLSEFLSLKRTICNIEDTIERLKITVLNSENTVNSNLKMIKQLEEKIKELRNQKKAQGKVIYLPKIANEG